MAYWVEKIGKEIHYSINFTVGFARTNQTLAVFSLPNTVSLRLSDDGGSTSQQIGNVYVNDKPVASCRFNASSQMEIKSFTCASGDRISMQGIIYIN